METPVHYQVVFSGRVRDGYTVADVKRNLAQRLKLPREKVERLFAGGRAVLKQTHSQEEAKRIVMQLAGTGALATIVKSHGGAARATATDKPSPAASDNSQEKATLKNFSPLRVKMLLKPVLYLTATIEVLLGLLYAGLILVIIGGVLIPALTSSFLGQYVSSPLLALPLQIVVIVLAGLFLLMLLKPLLALRIETHQGVPLAAEEEPDLYAFIEDVCEQIGAPTPTEIRLYNDADLKTAYHRGPLGFLQNRTVLSIGVPLIAGMNCSQMAALIARSLNRYRHKFAPRATAILLAVHDWLQRAAYGQDIVDRTLQRWHEEGRLGEGMFRALQWLVVPSRKMVTWRLRLSRILERGVVHRIVAEADKKALAFTGTDGFIRLLDQNSLLAFAGKNLQPGLAAQWQDKGVLPNNLVRMMVLRSRQYPVSMPQKLRALQEQQKAAIGDIIPSDNQRLKRIGQKPIYAAGYCLSPAATLFRNYSKLTRQMTLLYYHHHLHLPVSPYRLQKVSGKGSMDKLLQQRLDAYLRKLYVDFVPLRLRLRMHDVGNLADAKSQWSAGKATGSAEYNEAKQAKVHFDEAEAALVDMATLEAIYLAGVWRQWGEVKLKNDELEEVHQSARDSESDYTQAVQKLEQYLKPYGMRLGAALAAIGGNSPLKQETQLLLSTLELIENVHAQLRELKLHTLLLETLLSLQTNSRQQKLDDSIEQHAADVQRLARAIGFSLKSAPYPFSDRKADKLMTFVQQNTLTEASPRGDFDRGNDIVEKLSLVHRRALARLIEIAVKVEKGLGF